MFVRASLPFRVAISMLLVLIAGLAIPTHALPIQLEQGSAFSASSPDVSLAARRNAAPEVKLAPAPLPLAQLRLTNAPGKFAIPRMIPLAHDATGPPLRPLLLLGGPSPRAPPALS